eukprot:UN14754
MLLEPVLERVESDVKKRFTGSLIVINRRAEPNEPDMLSVDFDSEASLVNFLAAIQASENRKQQQMQRNPWRCRKRSIETKGSKRKP